MAEVAVDALDQLAAREFEGYAVRKNLTQRCKRRYPVPENDADILLDRYCTSTNEDEIADLRAPGPERSR